MGRHEYFVVEFPKGSRHLRKAWEYVEKAQVALAQWDSKSVYAHCRELGKLLDKTILEQHAGDASTTEKWGRAYKHFNHMASLDLHREEIQGADKFDGQELLMRKADSEHVLFTAQALFKYASSFTTKGG
ncbi:MAG: hypothetical protein V2A71_07350 [Candidatus Eisenbacteria bacterium]